MVNKKGPKCSKNPQARKSTNYLVEPNSSKRFNVVMKHSSDLSDLKLAYKYVTPVLDAIITQATSYTETEFQKILESNSTICSITRDQFTKAVKASEIVNEIAIAWPVQKHVVNTVSIPFNEITEQIGNAADRICIDRDLMKKLVDLHELITETIKKLKEEAAAQVTNLEDVYTMKTTEHKLEEVPAASPSSAPVACPSSAPVEDLPSDDTVKPTSQVQLIEAPSSNKNMASSSIYKPTKIPIPVKKSNLRTLTVEPAEDMPDAASQSSEVLQVVPSNISPEETILEEHELDPSIPEESDLDPTMLDENEFDPPITSSRIASHVSYHGESTIVGPSAADVTAEDTSAASMTHYMENNTISNKELTDTENTTEIAVEMDEDFVLAPEELDVERDKATVESSPTYNAELDRFRKLFQQLQVALEYIKKRTYTSISDTHIPPANNKELVVYNSKSELSMPASCMQKTRAGQVYTFEDALQTQREILGCLKELAEMKEILKKIDNPELEVDTSPTSTRPCCNVNLFPHVHAKLNGVAVIVKLNQDTIDVLLAERFEVQRKNRACSCSGGRVPPMKAAVQETPFYETRLQDNDQVILRSSSSKYRCTLPCRHELTVTNLLDFNSSITSLPYTCTRKSLPNVNICSAMQIKVDKLKTNMTTQMISYPKLRIKQKLIAVGVDNLIEISKPARCCRRAVINERVSEEDPYHASLNSLPLTNSDLRTINNLVVRAPKCMSNKPTYHHTTFEYYTNFQENFASNVEYFVPKTIEVRFFNIFPTSSTSKFWNLFRKSSTTTKEESNPDSIPNQKKTHNKRCQTEPEPVGKKDNIYQPSANSLPIKINARKRRPRRNQNHKAKQDLPINCSLKDTTSLSPKNYAETLSGIYEIGSNGKVRPKQKQCPEEFPATHSIFSYNSGNLGTIFEHDEKKERLIREHSFSGLVQSPEMSRSFQQLIATKSAIKAFERSNMSVDQFWQVYFGAKKSSKSVNYSPSLKSISSQQIAVTVSKKKLRNEPAKPVDSRIPRKISRHSNKQIGETKGETTKIYFTDMLEEAAKCRDFRTKSIKSLQILASKNGPGYVAVLHPICGCPEVSIFIPCYCDDANSTKVNKEELLDRFEDYLGRNDGRHVVLPKTCRINGETPSKRKGKNK